MADILSSFKKIFDEELEKYAKDYDYPDIAMNVLGHSDVRALCYEVCKRIKSEDNNEYGWEDVVRDCERVLGLEGHAENPLMSNLPNAIRDLKADKTPGEIKIIHDCTQCSHKNVCPILPLYRNSGIVFDLKTCAFFNKNT